jgi:hypothetical protein|nr:MAG TPA: hypothetical protein [Caudoviricetes sp.]
MRVVVRYSTGLDNEYHWYYCNSTEAFRQWKEYMEKVVYQFRTLVLKCGGEEVDFKREQLYECICRILYRKSDISEITTGYAKGDTTLMLLTDQLKKYHLEIAEYSAKALRIQKSVGKELFTDSAFDTNLKFLLRDLGLLI